MNKRICDICCKEMDKYETAIIMLEETWENLVGNYRYQNAKKIDTLESYYLAIQALKEKVERDKMRCQYCNTNPCWGCAYAGECRTIEHCSANNRVDYKARFNYCHICGRDMRHGPFATKENENG